MIRSVIRFMKNDLSGFSTAPMFKHSFYAINCGNNNSSKAKLGDSYESKQMGHLSGDKLQDLLAALGFQKTLVYASKA